MARKYSKKEMDFILNNYKTMSNSEIGKILNLSMDAIRSKLRRLEIKKSPEDIKKIVQDNKHKCGRQGDKHHFYGKHRTEEVKEKISKKLTGVPLPKEQVQKGIDTRKRLFSEGKLKVWNDGLDTEEINKHYKNNQGPNTGKILGPLSEKHKKSISLGNTGKKRTEQMKKDFSESLIKSGARALEKNSNWQDGKSFEIYPREFNKSFKEAIKIRDGFLCLKCGMREEDMKIILKVGLDIHHINYDKKLNIKENACCLCRRCHGETNFNRPSWSKFFQSMLSERYGYQYTDDGTILINSDQQTLQWEY